MIKEGNSCSDPYTKFRSAGKLAKTVAHWKTKGIDVAVSRKLCLFLAKEMQLFKTLCLLPSSLLKACMQFPFILSEQLTRTLQCLFYHFTYLFFIIRQIPRESSTMRGSRTRGKWWVFCLHLIFICLVNLFKARKDHWSTEHRKVISTNVPS